MEDKIDEIPISQSEGIGQMQRDIAILKTKIENLITQHKVLKKEAEEHQNNGHPS